MKHSEFDTVVAEWGSQYVEPRNPNEWETCRQCGYKPKIWEFNNGRYAQCACSKDYSMYKRRKVSSESVMSVAARMGGSLETYDIDALRKEWNNHVLGRE